MAVKEMHLQVPMMIYGMETLTLSIQSANNLITTQKAIERINLGLELTLGSHSSNEVELG